MTETAVGTAGRKLVIACDVDEVVAHLHPEWLKRYNRDWGDSLQPCDLDRWAINEVVKPECGKEIFKYLHDRDLYEEVAQVEGALNAIWHLRAQGHRVVFVTSSNKVTAGQKIDWLQRHGFVPADEEAPWDLMTGADKGLIHADVLIDDAPHNLTRFLEANPGATGIVFSQPHNAGARIETEELVVRAASWTDVVVFIEWLAEQPRPSRAPSGERLATSVATDTLHLVGTAGATAAPADETILQEAQRLVHGDRQSSYGHPHDDYVRTSRMWEGFLGLPAGFIGPMKAALMMALMKASRLAHKPKRDSFTDLAGYAECAHMIATRVAELEAERDAEREVV